MTIPTHPIHQPTVQSSFKYGSKKFLQNLAELKNKVFIKRPALQNLIENYGRMSLYEFAKIQLLPRNNQHLPAARKKEFIECLTEAIAQKISPEVAKSAALQLEKNYFLSTTDHHGPLTHSGFLNSNLLSLLVQLDSGKQSLKNIILLACGNISFDNWSFPRGLLFHSYSQNELKTNQLVFFSRSARPCPVFGYPAYTEESLVEAQKRIDMWVREKTISLDTARELRSLLTDIYNTSELLSKTTFADQVSLSNYHLWNKILSRFTTKKTNLIYLQQEELINTIIVKKHLRSDTFVNNLLFNSKYHDLLVKYFDHATGAFSLQEKVGTFLFWALPKGQKYRIQLWKQGNKLVSEDGSYSLDLTPDALEKALTNGELLPSTLLSFIILSFYYGVELLGGMNQTTYFTEMKYAFIKLVKELGDDESVRMCTDLFTTRQAFSRAAVAMMEVPNTSPIGATFIDLLLYGYPDAIESIRNTAQRITVEQATLRVLPILYKALYNTEIEDGDPLLSIDEASIESHTGIHKEVSPCGYIVPQD